MLNENTNAMTKILSALSLRSLRLSSEEFEVRETAETQRTQRKRREFRKVTIANSLSTVPTSFDPTYVPCNLRT
jgi:hypothetical protein